MPLVVWLLVLLAAVAGDAAHGARPRRLRVPRLLPNYLGLTGGSTFGVSSDCTGCAVRATTLVDQLERAHVSWKAYMEGMPRPYFGGAESGLYVKRHDPFLHYVDVASSTSRCRRVVPLTQLSVDIARRALPRFVWITPDLCHDMHSCGVRDGDRFLAHLVPQLLRAVGPRGAVFLTWDEGDDRAGCGRDRPEEALEPSGARDDELCAPARPTGSARFPARRRSRRPRA